MKIQRRLVCLISPSCDSEASNIDHDVRHDLRPTLIDKDLPSPILYCSQSSNLHNQVLSSIYRINITIITIGEQVESPDDHSNISIN